MEPNIVAQNIPPSPPLMCSYCHQPVSPEFYFCPNCGNKLQSAPLSTTPLTQAGIYALSIIMPSICFLAITKWPGLKYYRSQDPKAKLIGTIAIVLLIASTIITFWLVYVSTVAVIQSQIASINSDLSF